MRVLAALDQLADAGHAGGAQQLAQLGELLVVAVGHRGDHVGALAGAALRPLAVRRWAGPGCPLGGLHNLMVAPALQPTTRMVAVAVGSATALSRVRAARSRSTASSRRSSGVVSEIRKKPSPFGP